MCCGSVMLISVVLRFILINLSYTAEHTHTHTQKNKLINENENKNLTAIYTAELFPRILTCRFRFFNFRRKDLDVTNFQLQYFIRIYI